MNWNCLFIYIVLGLIIYHYDNYTGILLLLLIIPPFKIANKEYFFVGDISIPTITNSKGQIIADIPKPSPTSLQNNINTDETRQQSGQCLGDILQVDDVKVNEILRQIKAQVDFDPYKTNLDKSVIYEIYNKYFNNDIFEKLKKNNDDSSEFIAAGNFSYIPTIPKLDYDLITYQNLQQNTQFGINPLTDGLQNNTDINRG